MCDIPTKSRGQELKGRQSSLEHALTEISAQYGVDLPPAGDEVPARDGGRQRRARAVAVRSSGVLLCSN